MRMDHFERTITGFISLFGLGSVTLGGLQVINICIGMAVGILTLVWLTIQIFKSLKKKQ
jgi:hypothetical protein